MKQKAVTEAFSQSRNELILHFDLPGSLTHPSIHDYVVVSCDPAQNYVYETQSFARKKRNSVDLFRKSIGRLVESVSIDGDDRQISLQLGDGDRLVIQMFGSKANVLLVNSRGEIVDAFLRGRDVVGTALTSRAARETFPDGAIFLQRLRNLGDLSLGVALKKFFPQFGATLLTELLYRAGLSRSETIDRLSGEEMERIFTHAQLLIGELQSSCRPCLYFDRERAAEFSIVELHHCNDFEKREFESLSEAIRMYLRAAGNDEHISRDRARIRQGLSRELERLTRTLEKISEESEAVDRAGRYEMMGELLKSHLHELHKGMTEAVLENTLDGSNENVTVPLDRNLTPSKNVERYFDKAKRSRTAVTEQRKQAEKLKQQQRILLAMLRDLDAIVTSEQWNEFLAAQHEPLRTLGLVQAPQGPATSKEEVPFRVFRVTGDFVVWAGKSGENNDLLSTRYTKPRDLWFHARAVGGSHVVLKSGSGKGEISKHAINEAAAIAAYYSKMKTSKLVPVSVCEGKYVRKPKGAPAGTVTIDREKVIFVEPRLPSDE